MRRQMRTIVPAFVVVGVVTLLSMLIVYWAGLRVYATNSSVLRCRQTVDSLDETLATLADAETGQRGFLLTGEEKYLEPYNAAKARIRRNLADLDHWATTGELHHEDVDTVQRLTARKLEELERTIELRRQQGPEAALAVVRSDLGQQIMDELRAEIARMAVEEEKQFTARWHQRDVDNRMRSIVTVAMGLVTLTFLVWAFARIRRGMASTEEQRQLLAVTLESIGDGVIVTDAQGRVTFLNGEAERLTGWKSPEAAGHGLPEVFRIINEETRQPVENPVDKVLRLKTIVGLANHTILVTKDGREIPIDDSGAPIRQADGRIQGVVLVFRDFSARRAAEETHKRLSAIVETSEDAILSKDLSGRIRTWNAAAERMFGYRAEEIVGQSILRLLPPERQDEEQQIVEKLQRGERIEHMETVRVTKDGRRLDVSVSVSPMKDRDGRVTGASKILRDITERKRAAAEIERQRNLLAVTLESIGDGVIVTDAQGRVTFLNTEAERLTGWQGEDAAGRGLPEVFKIINEGTRQPVESPVDKVLRLGTVVGLANHTILIARDGRETPIDDSGAPIRQADGTVHGVVLVFRDFSAQKQAERALENLAEQRRLALEAADLGAWDYRFDTGEVFWDERCRNLFGVASGEEIAYNGAVECIHPDDRATVDQAVQAALREVNGGTYHQEFRVVWPDGSIHWVASHGRAYFEGAGAGRRAVRFIGANLDITARKEAEETLRQSEERFRTLADAIPQLAWMANGDGWITWYNRRWYEYTGTTPKQMEGWGWQSVHDPKQLPRVMQRWQKSIDSGEPFDMTFPLRGADGTFRPFLTRVLPLKDSTGRVQQWFGTNTDISEQKKTEDALAAARVSAERAKAAAEEASHAKDHFLAILSHELRTPLTPVLTTASLLGQDSEMPERYRDDLEMIRRNVELEARLIDDLLDVTRITRGKVSLDRQLVELGAVIRRAVEVCQPDIQARRLKFALDLGEAAQCVIEVDNARMQQVFWNLLKNAIKFTPPGGYVGVRGRCDGDGFVEVEVNDSGTGIEPEVVPRLFNAFEQGGVRVTRQFGGLGLGLTITKGLVEMHGGHIAAFSEGRGKGASFRVRLPLSKHSVRTTSDGDGAAAGDDHGTARRGTAARTTPRTLRILLVEDHADTARIMRRLLMTYGHEVELAGDIATALELAERHGFDLLLSDLGLPDGSGIDLMRELRARGHKMPGIALSGYGQEQDIQRSHEAGFGAHLTKPVSLDRLAEAIATATA